MRVERAKKGVSNSSVFLPVLTVTQYTVVKLS